MKVPIYLIGIPTGQRDQDGVEMLIVIDIKLTRLAAEQVQLQNPTSEIRKLIADKEA